MSLIDTAVALCAVGAEKILSNEIRKLGLKVMEGGFGQVRFKTDLQGLYRSLMALRTADRLLLEAVRFEALDFDALFEGVRQGQWEDLVPPNHGLRVVKVRTNRSILAAETSIQAVVHKAAAERLCAKRGISRLPEGRSGSAANEAELRVFVEKNQVSVLLDLSGDPLFKRGYRLRGGTAPLRETTAAAIVLYSGWRRKFPLYDPFCGSGTIAIEAAMYAWDIAPGLARHFALEKLLIARKDVEQAVREELLSKVDFSRLVRLGGSDSDGALVEAARSNMKSAAAQAGGNAAGIHSHEPSFREISMEDAGPDFAPVEGDDPNGPRGFIITNPPYGRRLGDVESAEKTYAQMARLGRHFAGWHLSVITDHPGFESFFGKKADSCREITNGAVRSYLYQYDSI